MIKFHVLRMQHARGEPIQWVKRTAASVDYPDAMQILLSYPHNIVVEENMAEQLRRTLDANELAKHAAKEAFMEGPDVPPDS